MSNGQKVIITIGILLMLIATLYPPTASTSYSLKNKVYNTSIDYDFLFSGYYDSIRLDALLAEYFAIILICGLVYWLFNLKKKEEG